MPVTTITTPLHLGWGMGTVEDTIVFPPGMPDFSTVVLAPYKAKRGTCTPLQMVRGFAVSPTKDPRLVGRYTLARQQTTAGYGGTSAGMSLDLLAVQWDGHGPWPHDGYPASGKRLLAPRLSVASAVDLAVDADCPAPWGDCRIVWVDGRPTWCARSGGTGFVATGRQRTHADIVGLKAGETDDRSAHLASHGDELYCWTHPANGGVGSVYPPLWRADLPDDVDVAVGGDGNGWIPNTATTTARVRWRSVDEPATPAVGAVLSGWTTVPSWADSGYVFASPGSVAVPAFAGPRRLGIEAELHAAWTSDGESYEWGTTRWLLVSNEQVSPVHFPATAPLPYPLDIPRFAPASDDATTRYVANAGAVRPPHGLSAGLVGWTAPTVSRAGRVVTVSGGGPTAGATVGRVIRVSCTATGEQAWPLAYPATTTLSAESVGHPVAVEIDWSATANSTHGWQLRTQRWVVVV